MIARVTCFRHIRNSILTELKIGFAGVQMIRLQIFSALILINLAAPLAVATSSDAATPAPAAGMKLVFSEDFDGTALDTTKWFAGPKPEGDSGQWGGAYFVKQDDPRFKSVYHVEDGKLRIRAFHDPNFQDPSRWGRKWYSGQISSAFPGGRVTGAARKGYFVARMKMPDNPGAWSAFWMLNTQSINKALGKGAVEIDVVEAYGHDRLNYMATIHDWKEQGKSDGAERNTSGRLRGANLTTGYHDYAALVTDKEVVWYFDDIEIFRHPLYRADDFTMGKFFVLLDLAISQDWPVKIPENGQIDLFIDSVQIYSAD